MKKTRKKALALLLACSMVFTSGMRMESRAMSGGIVAGGGAVVGAETALAYLLGVLGLSAASAAVYDNRDSIAKWGKTQMSNLTDYINEKSEALSVTAASMQTWLEKVGKGTLDKAGAEWTAFKSWVASHYATGGVVDTVVTDQNDFPATDGAAAVGNWTSWEFSRGTFTDGYGKGEQFRCFEISGDAQNAFLFTVAAWTGTRTLYLLGAISLSPDTKFTSYYKNVYLDGSERIMSKITYSISGRISPTSNFYYTGVDDCENKEVCTMPNFVGNMGSYNSYLETINDKELGPKAAVAAYNKYLAGDFNVPKTKIYTETGGISSAYETGKTLENIDVVGVGAKAGATDVAIPWPEDNTLGGIIGGVISGTNTWQDIIDAIGVGVISKDGAKDYVVDDVGVTTREWEYGKDDTGATDKPDEIEVSKDLEAYTFAGLEKLFPFCLPFDLIDFIGVLDADPQAPCFTFPIKYPTATGWAVYDLVIDLSQFDSVAELLRTMETLLFIVGLTMITRQKMIRG